MRACVSRGGRRRVAAALTARLPACGPGPAGVRPQIARLIVQRPARPVSALAPPTPGLPPAHAPHMQPPAPALGPLMSACPQEVLAYFEATLAALRADIGDKADAQVVARWVVGEFPPPAPAALSTRPASPPPRACALRREGCLTGARPPRAAAAGELIGAAREATSSSREAGSAIARLPDTVSSQRLAQLLALVLGARRARRPPRAERLLSVFFPSPVVARGASLLALA